MQEDAWDDSLKLLSNPCNSEGMEATSLIKDFLAQTSSYNFEVMILTVSANARLSADFKEKDSFSNEWENIHVQT